MKRVFLPWPSKHGRLLDISFSALLGILLLYSLAVHASVATKQSVRAAQSETPTTQTLRQAVGKPPPLAPLVTDTPTPVCDLRWRDMNYPFPNGAYGIATISSNDVWLATSTGLTHWDGTQWTSSGPSGTLQDISALTASDIWAVGYNHNGGGSTSSLIVHWDGVTWTTVASPNPDPIYNALDGVKALAPDNVWAVGEQTGVLHWDGIQWTQVYVPGPYIYPRDIDALSATDIWVVGNQYALPSYSVALHWNGSNWSQLPSPNPSTNENVLQAVVAISTNDVWATGFQCCSTGGVYHTLIEHWDGSQWSLVPGQDPGDMDNRIMDIAAASPNDVWAVGSFQDSSVGGGALIEQWDGQQWAYVPVENGPTGPGPLYAVGALSVSDVWTAGRAVMRYYDPCATPAPSSTPTSTGIATFTPTVGVPTETYTATSTPALLTSTSTPYPTESSSPTVQATITLIATPTETPCGLSFSDVHEGDYFYQPALYLACRGAISGYSDGTFRPYNDTTRGQLSKIVVLASGWVLDTTGGPHFSDVTTSNPFYAYIETAYHHGVISGYSDGTFRWGSNITRAQLTKIIVLARGWQVSPPQQPTFSDVPVSHPFYSYIETAYAHNIISGYSCGDACLEFRPGSYATRAQIAKIIYGAVTQP